MFSMRIPLTPLTFALPAMSAPPRYTNHPITYHDAFIATFRGIPDVKLPEDAQDFLRVLAK